MTGVVDGARHNADRVSAIGQVGPEDLTQLPPGIAPWFTVIIPTRNEEGSVAPLLERLAASLGNAVVEVLFVDDSQDATPQAIRTAARSYGLAVRLLHREPGQRSGGLGGAVVAGLSWARGPWAVVMDGDLQHPPELVARLVAIGVSRQLDLVAGSRYIGAGTSDGLSGGYRRAVSGAATATTKTVFPRRLAQLSDPMSGFFAVRLAALDVTRLNPIGFKILMEIAVRQPRLRVAEVPFVFGSRVAGDSKASGREGLRFARHLARLRFEVFRRQVKRSSVVGNRAARLKRFLGFGLVGASGIAINTLALWLLSVAGNTHYLIAAILATEASTTWNFVLTETLVFRNNKPGSRLGRGVKFYLVNHLALVLRLPLLALLVGPLGMPLLIANLITLILLFAVRFQIADSAIYAPVPVDAPEREPMKIVVNTSEAQLALPPASR